MTWLIAHWPAVTTVLAVALASTITALTRYPDPRRTGLIVVLQVLLDVLSVLGHRDSPTGLQLPLLTRSAPPPDTVITLRRRAFDDLTPEPPSLIALAPILLAAGLALPACAPGWQQRTADRIDCYGPLVDRAVGLILDAAHDPARALVGAVELYREIRATLGEPDVRTCALHRLEAAERAPASAGGEKMGGEGDRLRAIVHAGLEAEEGQR